MTLPASLIEAATSSLNPQRSALYMTRLADNRGDKPWPEVLLANEKYIAAIAHLFAYTTALSEFLVSKESYLDWLFAPDFIERPRVFSAVRAEYVALTKNLEDPSFRIDIVRRLKEREMLRIAFRDMAGLASVEETTRELSLLADLCVQTVLDVETEVLIRKYAKPDSGFSILGMGKLGGYELNYHSDIDIIFVYSCEGQTTPHITHHEFFSRLAEAVTRSISRKTSEGQLFRVDLRLRPEGDTGNIARSLESYENYYAEFGETWERMALMKARHIAGDQELSYEFIQAFQSFTYPRLVSPEVLDEIARLKARIEREVVGSDKLNHHVKLGMGGIREIEFTIQTLQLLEGAKNPILQTASSIKGLTNLLNLQILSREDAYDLKESYFLLRNVEHRLQMVNNQQTHTIPADEPAQKALALSLGFESVAQFWEVLNSKTTRVREIYQKVFQHQAPREDVAPDIAEFGFWNPDDAQKTMESLMCGKSDAHVGPRVRQSFFRIVPTLKETLPRLGNPDLAISSLERFVEAYGTRAYLYETFATNPKVLELLLQLFDGSRFLTDVLTRRPELFEEVARSGTLDYLKQSEAFLKEVQEFSGEKAGDKLRVYRRGEILRIALRDMLNLATLPEINTEYSSLAEACLKRVVDLVWTDHSIPFAVIALGKFGGRELTYGSDLDIIFVGDNLKAARDVIDLMTKQTGEGILFPIDTRLRPEGDSGLLTIGMEAFKQYYVSRAETWERQALTRARFVAGDAQLGEAFETFAESQRSKLLGQSEIVFREFSAMREKIKATRSNTNQPEYEFKTGEGGLLDIEFIVQALQMIHGIHEPNTLVLLETLRDRSILSRQDYDVLYQGYIFIRKTESVLRRFHNSAVSTLPKPGKEFTIMLRRLNLRETEFWDLYQAHRLAIHTVYKKTVL